MTLGLGAALSQVDEHGLGLPVSFAIRMLCANGRKWAITELEVFAVVSLLESFRMGVEGSSILVRTD